MQIKKTLARLLLILLRPHLLKGCLKFVQLFLLLLPFSTVAQTTYLPQDDKANILMERMEIKFGTDSMLNFSKTRPYSRQSVMAAASFYKKMNIAVRKSQADAGLSAQAVFMNSKVDAYNLHRLVGNNLEWYSGDPTIFQSKKPIWKNFYKTPANLYEVHIKDFDLVINPVIQFVVAKEKDNDETLYLNTRGLNIRGKIANKIGFYAYVTDNQEKDPFYVRDWVNRRKAVPGQGFYKQFKQTGYDYFDARGYFTFNVTRYINVAFGYDKNFIGNGYRSMFLGDAGNSNLFLKLNTRIWKINYQNLFMELQSAYIPGGDKLIPKKYAAMHHLDVSFTKWLNIGLFEGVVFGRKDRFDFSYLNPIIFYRSIEQQNGSFDNSVAGLDIKANLAKKIQLYGQLCLDEFLLSEITKNHGYWGNKWSIQAGGKYIDAFGIRNLDLQGEINIIRPYTYSHNDSVANYTHYNQPLAHPLGANFREFIGLARYQPAPKWLAVAKLIYYQQGRDSNNISYGSNIFLINIPPYRIGDFGHALGSGWKTNVLYASILLSYEIKENLFLELNAIYRKQETKTAPITSTNTSIVSFGVRWNMHRREFDY